MQEQINEAIARKGFLTTWELADILGIMQGSNTVAYVRRERPRHGLVNTRHNRWEPAEGQS